MDDIQLVKELADRGFGIADGSLCVTHDRISSGHDQIRCTRFHEIVEANLARTDRQPIKEPFCVFRPITVVLAAIDEQLDSIVRLGIANL